MEITEKYKIPKKMEKFGYCLSKNNKFGYIFGGFDGADLDDVYIWNLQKMTIIQSKIKCPLKNTYFVVAIGQSKHKSLLIINGFIRYCNKRENDLCDNIIQLILLFYFNQTIHLMDRINTKNHWYVDVRKIHSL